MKRKKSFRANLKIFLLFLLIAVFLIVIKAKLDFFDSQKKDSIFVVFLILISLAFVINLFSIINLKFHRTMFFFSFISYILFFNFFLLTYVVSISIFNNMDSMTFWVKTLTIREKKHFFDLKNNKWDVVFLSILGIFSILMLFIFIREFHLWKNSEYFNTYKIYKLFLKIKKNIKKYKKISTNIIVSYIKLKWLNRNALVLNYKKKKMLLINKKGISIP